MNKLYNSVEDTGKLLDAKVLHGQLFLFTLKDNTQVIFRLLTMAELEAIGNISKVCVGHGIEEWVVEKTLIWCSRGDRYLFDTAKAGHVNKIALCVLQKSNIKDDKGYKQILDQARERNSTLDSVVASTIGKVFPTLDPRNLDYYRQTRLLSIAEEMLQTKILIGEEINTKKSKRGPRIPPGYESIGGEIPKSELLAKENADKPNFEKDNAALRNL